MFLGQLFANNTKNDPIILFVRDSSFVALLILRHIFLSYKTIDRSLKTAPLVAFPVNSYCWSKSAEHDVTLMSFTTHSKLPES